MRRLWTVVLALALAILCGSCQLGEILGGSGTEGDNLESPEGSQPEEEEPDEIPGGENSGEDGSGEENLGEGNTEDEESEEEEPDEDIWVLVADESELSVGSRVIIAANGYDLALGTTQNNNNRSQANIMKSGNTVSFGNDTEIMTLESGCISGTFAFRTGTGYLYAASSGSNHLRTQSDIDANASWSIDIGQESIATIKAQGNNSRNWLRYNSSSSLFSCYSTGQKDVILYKSDGNGSAGSSGGESGDGSGGGSGNGSDGGSGEGFGNGSDGESGGTFPPVTGPAFDGIDVSSTGDTHALVYCTGSRLTPATLTFYARSGASTVSTSPSMHYETYAQAEFSNLKPSTTYTCYVEAKFGEGQVVKSEETAFTTRSKSIETTYGWLELPAKGDVSTANEHVFRSGERNYTAYYDTKTYSSLWVAYPLAKGHSGNLSRPGGWYYASGIPQSDQVNLTKKSYNDDYSRGHQIPNGDRNGNSGMQKQTFYVINSVPQIQNGFNGGIWNALEDAIRGAIPSVDSLYVATGPVYQTVGGSEPLKYTSAKEDSKQLPVPNYFFKVVLKVKRSGGKISDAIAVGFWFDHKVYSGNSYESCAISVRDIEKKTGYDFFANLPDEIETVAEQNASWSKFKSF